MWDNMSLNGDLKTEMGEERTGGEVSALCG
jgi:hypothetical protein